MRHILIMDRNPSGMEGLVMALQHGGFQVTTVSDVDRVSNLVSQATFDLVLLDVCPPTMQGLALREDLQLKRGSSGPLVLFLVEKADEERVYSLLSGSFDYITKPFDPVDVVACIKSYLPDLPPELDLNPLTELPGLRRIDQELSARIAERRPFALLDVDISNLRPFRSTYGSLRANHAIRLVARILTDASRMFGASDDVVAHISDDDFYVVTAPERAYALCQRAVSRFDDRIKDLYRQSDLSRGYVECEYPLGYIARHALMTLAIGGATSANRGADDPRQVRRLASEVRALAKASPSSTFRFDERRDDLVFDRSLVRMGRQNKPLPLSRRSPKLQWEREKSQFIYFITNQLRLPVTILQSTLDYLAQASDSISPTEQRRYLGVLRKHARHLSDSVSQLATLYKLCEGDVHVRLSVVDVEQVLAEVLAFVGKVVAEKDIRLELRKEGNASGLIVDEQILCQILTHTLYSISEYAFPDTTISIDIAPTESTVMIKISVKETSLARHDLVKVFRSFYRPKDAATSSYDSLGIGFHLARHLLGTLGGIMTVQQDERLYITLELPRMCQSVEEKLDSARRDMETSRSLLNQELAQIASAFSGPEKMPGAARAALERIGHLIDQMISQAGSAVCLADETLSQLSIERQRSTALDAGFITFLEAMVELVERRDIYFSGHSKRVAEDSLILGRALDLPEAEVRELYYAALLHDVGMIGVPDAIVNKPEQLSSDEMQTVRQHPLIGSRSLGVVDAFGPVIESILYHHERYDGTGYPLGLKGERIPLAARILAVADTFDALTSSRPYRPAMAPGIAIDRINAEAGIKFDPRVVAAFAKARPGLASVRGGASNGASDQARDDADGCNDAGSCIGNGA